MNEEFLIKLSAKIDDSSKTVNSLNNQIKAMESQIKDLELKVDTSNIKASSGDFNTLKDALKSVKASADGSLEGFTQLGDKIKSNGVTITKYTNDSNQLLTVTQKAVGEENLFSASIETVRSNMAKSINTVTNLKEKYKSYDDVIKSLGVDLKDFQKTNSSKDSNGNVIESWTNNSGKIVSLQGKMIDGNLKYTGSLKEVDSAVDKNAKQADKWNYKWTKAFQSFTTYKVVTEVFYQAKHAIEEMVGEVIELDSALVELKKVSDLEGASLDDFVKKAYAAADGVAKTGTEMVDAATQFAKAGYDDEEVLQLGKVALMYSNIADEELSAADSSEFIIAQLKAFNLESENMNETLKNSYHIIDAVNEVSNNFAVSSADIANNLGRSSSVMANAGNSLEEMIGLAH